MYLVDTDVLSTGAPARRRPSGLSRWFETHSEDLFVSTVTVAEIASGIAQLVRTDRRDRARDLEAWLGLVLHLYGERVLPFDATAARIAGQLLDGTRAGGQSPGFADIAIAATAASRDLTVLTRNVRHFGPLGVNAMDPLESLP